LTRGYDGANFYLFIGEVSPKREINFFKIRKLNGFGGFQSLDVRKNNNNKKKSLIFLYLVFSVCGKQILEG
jgi:hypothetical protein